MIANEFQRNTILINDGSGHFSDHSNALSNTPHDHEDIVIADFDGNNTPDIVIVSEDDSTHEYYLNNGFEISPTSATACHILLPMQWRQEISIMTATKILLSETQVLKGS